MNARPTPGLRLVHTVAGRTRLKFSELKTHPHRHPHLQQKLASIHGVHQVETNTSTGSIVLYHDRGITRSAAFLTAMATAFGWRRSHLLTSTNGWNYWRMVHQMLHQMNQLLAHRS